jgi:DNA-binding transcriptional ArsR family regulator
VNRRSDVADVAELDVVTTDGDIADAADVFGLLSDPGRLRLLIVLRAGEANVGQLAALSGLSESATSHALRLLRAHEVVRVRRLGRMAYYQLADAHVADLLDIALAHAEHSELTHPERT